MSAFDARNRHMTQTTNLGFGSSNLRARATCPRESNTVARGDLAGLYCDGTISSLFIEGRAYQDPAFFALRDPALSAGLLGSRTDRLYRVVVAGSAQGEIDLVARLELGKIDRRSDRKFHLHWRPVDGGDRTMVQCDLVVRSVYGRDGAGSVSRC